MVEDKNKSKMLITALFPNPASEHLFISINNKSDFSVPTFIQLSDVSGKVVFSQEYSGFNVTIPVNDFESGVYFLKVKQGNYCDLQKVIIH
jgi:hypothetical protein